MTINGIHRFLYNIPFSSTHRQLPRGSGTSRLHSRTVTPGIRPLCPVSTTINDSRYDESTTHFPCRLITHHQGLHTPPSGASRSTTACTPSSASKTSEPPIAFGVFCRPSKNTVEALGGATGKVVKCSSATAGLLSSSTTVKVWFCTGNRSHLEPRLNFMFDITAARGADEVSPASFVLGERLNNRTLASPVAGGAYEAAMVSIWSGSDGGQYVDGFAGFWLRATCPPHLLLSIMRLNNRQTAISSRHSERLARTKTRGAFIRSARCACTYLECDNQWSRS